MKRPLLCAALVLGGMTGTAGADRFLVQVGDMRPVYCNDAAGGLASLEPNTGMVPPNATVIAGMTPMPGQPAPGVAVDPAAVTQANRALTEPTPRLEGMHANMSEVIQGQSGPPDAAFLAQLNSVYSITAPEEIQQAWEWYLKEPATLPISSRVGNGVVRMIMALDRAPTGDSQAQPSQLRPEATSGVVRATNGVSVRSNPWQPGTGNALGTGATVTLIPPANGPWYQIQGGGWVCGLWLDLN